MVLTPFIYSFFFFLNHIELLSYLLNLLLVGVEKSWKGTLFELLRPIFWNCWLEEKKNWNCFAEIFMTWYNLLPLLLDFTRICVKLVVVLRRLIIYASLLKLKYPIKTLSLLVVSQYSVDPIFDCLNHES